MERLRNLRKNLRFLRDLKDNKVDFGDSVSVGIVAHMRKYRLWFTDKDFAKASPLDKLICYIPPLLTALVFINAISYQIKHFCEEPIDSFLLKMANVLVLSAGTLLCVIAIIHRPQISLLIDYLNVKSHAMTTRRESHRPLRNRVYLFLYASKLMLRCTLPIPILYATETLATGQLFFKSVVPFLAATPYSVSVYIQTTLHVALVLWLIIFASNSVLIVYETFLVLGTSFRIVAAEMKTLRNEGTPFTEDGEYQRLCQLFEEFTETKRYLDMANRVYWSVFAYYVFVSSFMTGLLIAVALFALGPWEGFFCLLFSCLTLMVAASNCFLGQYVTDSAQEMETAIYACTWYDAPRPFRKLVLLFLIRCSRPVLMDAGPFYDLNLMLLTKIMKSIYGILTLAKQIIK